MKIIKYNLCAKVNQGTQEAPVWVESISPVEMGWNEVNEEIARKEACNGEYTIEDDGQEASEPEPTADQVLNTLLGVSV